MASGWRWAWKPLPMSWLQRNSQDVYAVFGTVGRTMIKVMGGASGIIFGLLFYAGSKNMPPKSELSTQDFAEVFARALAEIQAKGQAQLGDKTIVDGLQPIVEALQKAKPPGKALSHAPCRLCCRRSRKGKKQAVCRPLW